MSELILLCPLIIDTPDFIAGFECGQVWEVLETGDEIEDKMIHGRSVEQVKVICDALARVAHLSQVDDTWWKLTTKSKLI